MSQPLVSVVIPVYNVEKYLNRCITSVVNQTYGNLEIILVDDGSPDNCPSICDKWAKQDSRIKVIHKENEGLGMARNTGIDNASGDYIFFFDSDDYVDITIAEKCVSAITESNSDAVVFGRYDVYEDGTLKEHRVNASKTLFDSEEIKNELLPGMFTYDMGFGVSAWGKMFSTDSIRNNNIRFKSEKEIISEDAYFTLEFFAKASSARIIGENLYFYFKRSNSLSRAFKKDRQQKNNIFLEKSLAFIKDTGLPECVGTHVKARYHSFTLAAMKQIFTSDLNVKEKKKEIYSVFSDPVLHNTLDSEVLALENSNARLFFSLIKKKCFLGGYLLLGIKTLKKI